MNFQYKIYGLRINSSRRINLLFEQPHNETDLSVYWTTNRNDTPDAAVEWKPNFPEGTEAKPGKRLLWTSETEEGVYSKIRFITETSLVDFVLDGSKKRLWIIHDKNEIESNLDSYFVGPALGFILRLRGIVCLHASSVNVNERAVIFLGYRRSGKSTTAAALAKLGYQVLADDIAAIIPKDQNFYVQPGYPKIRLRPKPVEALLDKAEAERLAKVYSHQSTRYLPLEAGNRFSSKPLPLGAIYLLGCINQGDTTPFLEAVKPPEKIIRLTENIIGRYFVNEELRKKEFLLLSDLVKKVPVSRLMFGHDLATLPQQCQTILEDFGKLTV